nr:nucleic acid-binding, OB-fold protein [Tanacetum cinerariifolium]
MIQPNRRDLPMDIPLDSVEVLRYEKISKSKIKEKVPTEMELLLEQTQQEHQSDTKVITMKMEILLEPTSNKLLVGEGSIGIPDECDPENTSWVKIPDIYRILDDENSITKLIRFIYDDDTLHGNIIGLALWNEMATRFDMNTYSSLPQPLVIAVSSCYVSRYNGLQLSRTYATHYYLNPDILETYHIKQRDMRTQTWKEQKSFPISNAPRSGPAELPGLIDKPCDVVFRIHYNGVFKYAPLRLDIESGGSKIIDDADVHALYDLAEKHDDLVLMCSDLENKGMNDTAKILESMSDAVEGRIEIVKGVNDATK